MCEKLRYNSEIKLEANDNRALLIRAVMYMHTKYVSMGHRGFDTTITGKFYSKENAKLANKEINERFFN